MVNKVITVIAFFSFLLEQLVRSSIPSRLLGVIMKNCDECRDCYLAVSFDEE